jgi:hypothetical protein
VIALCGDPEDLTTAYLGWQARQSGFEVSELSEAELGDTWALGLDDDRPERSWLELDGSQVPIAEVDGVFVRFNPRPGVPDALAGLAPEVGAALIAERRAGLDYALDRLPSTVVNRPSAGRSNGSKPFQMGWLDSAGFEVPRWILASRADEVVTFTRGCLHGSVHKTCSGLRSQVRRPDEELLEQLEAGAAPALIQEYVPGTDVRVHVVGERCFATEIRGAGLDYRYESEGAMYVPVDPPEDVARLCVGAAREERLLLAGIDFRLEPSGRWWCLESNPVPTFLPYEMSTGQPIAAALVDLLGSRAPRDRANVLHRQRPDPRVTA